MNREEYVDYAEVLEDFRESLQALRNHMHEHAFFEGYEDTVDEIDYTISKIDEYLLDTDDINAWEEIWESLEDHMEKWWC